MTVLIIKNITREGPGLIEEVLKKYRIEYQIVDLDKGEEFPDPTKYDALIVLGGPDSANDRTTKMVNELDQVKKAVEADIPYLGICLGLQVLVKAAGGKVVKGETKEIGTRGPDGEYFEIDINPDGALDPFFNGLSPPLNIFHLHGETVKLAGSMTLLATGVFCRNQAVKVGRKAYGLQGHFEVTEPMLKVWLDEDPDLKTIPRKILEDDYKKLKKDLDTSGRKIAENFLRISGLIK